MSASLMTRMDDLDTALAMERPRLVRLCASLSGHAEAAEDLAQETLLEAWRNHHKLYDPAGLRPWLAAIARNVCWRWARRGATPLGHLATPDRGAEPNWRAAEVRGGEDFDLEVDLDRDELALLLDRAMAQLPPETREALVERYVRESPIAEVAARLGMSEGAVAKRLERGKVVLRRVLATDLSAEAAAYGIGAADSDAWQETRIWCPGCGSRRLVGRFEPSRPLLALRCSSCHTPGVHTAHTNTLDLFAGLHGYKPALNRLMDWGYSYLATALAGHAVNCIRCGKPADPLLHMPPEGPLRDVRGVHVRCADCRPLLDISLGGLALWAPEGQRFWKQHGRIRALPEREVEVGGRAALIVGFEAVTNPARLELVFARESYTLLETPGRAVG